MLKLALGHTLEFFGWSKKSLMHIPLWIVGFVSYGMWKGWEVAIGEIEYAIIFGFIPIGGAFVVLFFRYLIKAYDIGEYRKRLWPAVMAEMYGDPQRVISVKVTNESSSVMKDCYGKLVGCDFVKKSRGSKQSREFYESYFPPSNHYFPWYLHRTEGNIDIKPDRSESLEVLTSYRGTPEYYYLCTLGGIDYQRAYVSDCEYIIEIGWRFREAERMRVKLTFTMDEGGVNVKEGLEIMGC